MRFHNFARLGFALLWSAAPFVTHAQFQAPTPEELKMTSDPKAPGADAVYLYREETEDDPHHFNTVYARLKILTEKGREAATIHIVYPRVMAYVAAGTNSSRSSSGSSNHWDAPDVTHVGEDQPYDAESYAANIEVKALEGRTIHPDGTIVPLGPSDDLLKVNRTKGEAVFTMPAVEVGSILEYRYQVRYDRFQSAPEWKIQQLFFVHKAHYLYTPTSQFLPNDVSGAGVTNSLLKDRHFEILNDIRYANVLPTGKAVNRDALGRYFIDLTDIPAIPQSPFAPPVAERIYQANFYYTYTVVEKEYWQKEMQFWTKDLTRYIAPTSLIQRTVAEVVTASDTPLDKAKKLYALVQKIENTDVTGEQSAYADSVPRGSVEAVLQAKKGDSNQIAYLYLALARAAGLNVRAERIASRDQHVFTPQFLSTSQLDSVIVALTIDGKEILTDPGTKMAPFQTLLWSHAGAGGIAMGANGKVDMVYTPLQLNSENAMVRAGSLNLTPQGTVSGTLKVGFIGQQAIHLRQLALKSGIDAVKSGIDSMLATQVPAGIAAHVDHFAYIDDPSKQLLAVVPVTGTLGTANNNRLTVPRLFFESRSTNPFPADDSRILPVDMRYPAQEQEQITYVLPSGFALESAPADSVMKWEENVAYQLRSKAAAGSVTSARILARGFTLLEPKDYTPLRDFYQKVIAADQQELVLVSATHPSGQ